MVVLAIISLVIIAAVCFLGTFSRKYDDNLAQRIGMALLCISAISRVRYLWLMEYVDFEWLLLYVGTAVFALGTVYQVVRRHRWNGVERRKHGARLASGNR
ncbi:MAG TPA: hypothetical protein VJ323_09535 [Bryobacteraceae bacterium]|jgi:hypothetical protein|nr:hypothetical protein [Bryobacteraceae bacterium]